MASHGIVEHFDVLENRVHGLRPCMKYCLVNELDFQSGEEALDHGSSHPGELPPEVLTEPYVKLSLHTALVIQP